MKLSVYELGTAGGLADSWGLPYIPHMRSTLSIETSADACNVSLIEPDRVISREADEPRSHARMLVPLIKELLEETDTRPDRICVDCGPGSYTGLRIGVSSAKGLAWSLGIPLYAVPSLALMAAGYQEEADLEDGSARCVIPARGNEVYTALYAFSADRWEIREAPRVAVLEDLGPSLDGSHILASSRALADRLPHAGAVHVIPPHSRHAAAFVRNPGDVYRVEDVSSFEPLYLREFEARKPAVSIFDRLPF